MDDVAFVSELEGAAGLIHDAQDARDREGMAGVEESLEAFALDKFHGDVVEAVFFAGIVDNHYVGMGEETGGAGFGLEAREKLGAAEAGAFFAEADGFDGNGAADDGVGSSVDNTHGAADEVAENFVAPCFYRCFHAAPLPQKVLFSKKNHAERRSCTRKPLRRLIGESP